MSYEQLCSSLGLDECGRPFIFSKVRHVGGLTAWTKEGSALFRQHAKGNTSSDQFKPLRMHWHQLSGAHAVIRKLFTSSKQPDNVPGMLIADEVGLGKSFLSILIVAFLIELGMRLKTNVSPPPLIGMCLLHYLERRLMFETVSQPYLRSSRKIPDRPSLIVVPGTLLRQWATELQTAFAHLSVDIFIYPSARANRSKFWNEEYAQSVQPTRNRVIVAPQSVSTSHSSTVFSFLTRPLRPSSTSTASSGSRTVKSPSTFDSPSSTLRRRLEARLVGRVRSLDASTSLSSSTKHRAHGTTAPSTPPHFFCLISARFG